MLPADAAGGDDGDGAVVEACASVTSAGRRKSAQELDDEFEHLCSTRSEEKVAAGRACFKSEGWTDQARVYRLEKKYKDCISPALPVKALHQAEGRLEETAGKRILPTDLFDDSAESFTRTRRLGIASGALGFSAGAVSTISSNSSTLERLQHTAIVTSDLEDGATKSASGPSSGEGIVHSEGQMSSALGHGLEWAEEAEKKYAGKTYADYVVATAELKANAQAASDPQFPDEEALSAGVAVCQRVRRSISGRPLGRSAGAGRPDALERLQHTAIILSDVADGKTKFGAAGDDDDTSCEDGEKEEPKSETQMSSAMRRIQLKLQAANKLSGLVTALNNQRR